MKRITSFLGFLSLLAITSLAYEAATFHVGYVPNSGVQDSITNVISGKAVSIAADITAGYTGSVVISTSAGVGSSLINGSRVLYTNSAVTGHVVSNLAGSAVYLYNDKVYMSISSPLFTNETFSTDCILIVE